MKMMILGAVMAVVGIVVIGVVIHCAYKSDMAYRDSLVNQHTLLQNQHADLANQHDKLFMHVLNAEAEAIKNGHKLDILLNIATNCNVDINK